MTLVMQQISAGSANNHLKVANAWIFFKHTYLSSEVHIENFNWGVGSNDARTR